MDNSAKIILLAGAFNNALAVILGAFGAHALKARLSEQMLNVYQTGIQYHFYHALGLVLIGLLALQLPVSGWLKWSAYLMLAGIVLFSGSLYALALSNIRWLGAVTPLGGTAFILAWLSLLVAIIKN